MTITIDPTEEMLMFDLETRSTDIQNGSIAQIGAVKFSIEGGVIDQFSVNIKHDSRFHISEDTMKNFWGKQPKHILESVFSNQVDFVSALTSFSYWLGPYFKKIVWSHGKEFDVGMLNNYYKVADMTYPFNYPRTADTRTVFLLAGVSPTAANTHNAVEDCLNQIKLLREVIGG